MASKKKKLEKQQKTPDVAPVEEVPKEREIVPGLYESDWLALVEREEEASIVAEVLQEILDVAYASIQHSRITRESYQYSVQWAKCLILQTLECHHLSHDPGEPDASTGSWTEDDEPSVPIVDSWARGVMPQTDSQSTEPETHPTPTPDPVSSPSPPPPAHTTPDHSTSPQQTGDNPPSFKPSPSGVRRRPGGGRRGGGGGGGGMTVIKLPTPHPAKFRPRPPPTAPPLPSPLALTQTEYPPPLPPPPSVAQSKRRGEGRKRSTLPTHSIKPHVRVVPSQQPSLPPHTLSRRPLGVARTGRRGTPVIRTADEKRDSISGLRYPGIPSIPPLVDVIDPQPGVTVREGGRSISSQASQRAWLHSPGTKHTSIPPLPAHTSKDSNNATSERGGGGGGGGGGVHMQPMATGVAGDMHHRTLNVT